MVKMMAEKEISVEWTAEELAAVIDNTEVRQSKSSGEMLEFCRLSREFRFGGICILPIWVSMARDFLGDSGPSIFTVVGLFGETLSNQVQAIQEGIGHGADGFDLLMPLHHVKGWEWGKANQFMEELVQAAAPKPVKVILESGCLTEDEIVQCCRICRVAGAAYVKTSTGIFCDQGATLEAVRLMRAEVGDGMGVKASGGIRSYQQAVEFLNAGASRIGSSVGVQIIEGARLQ